MLLLLALALVPWARREADCDPRPAFAPPAREPMRAARAPLAASAESAATSSAESAATSGAKSVEMFTEHLSNSDEESLPTTGADPPSRQSEETPDARAGDASQEDDPFGYDPSAKSTKGREDELDSSPVSRSLTTSLQVTSGRQGEHRIEALARAEAGEVTIVFGAETFASDRAPERRGAILGVELASGAVQWEGELRAMPQTAASSRVGARAGVRSEILALSIAARAESLGGKNLKAIGATAELEAPLAAAWSASVAASAWATELLEGKTHSRDPWGAFGAATLDWAERWEVSGGMKGKAGPLTIAPVLAVGQPAQPGAFAARASLAVELKLGPVRLTAAAGGGHLWPSEIWLADVTAGVAWRLGEQDR